jgi:hypothetical protein
MLGGHGSPTDVRWSTSAAGLGGKKAEGRCTLGRTMKTQSHLRMLDLIALLDSNVTSEKTKLQRASHNGRSTELYTAGRTKCALAATHAMSL